MTRGRVSLVLAMALIGGFLLMTVLSAIDFESKGVSPSLWFWPKL